MKENVFDVLIYLFENYMGGDSGPAPDPDLIRNELTEAGFPQAEITKAFEWLETLTEQQVIKQVSSPAFRIFSSREMSRLDADCRGLLLFLEQSGILTPASRELVIDRVMAFNDEGISLENLKWVVLMILFSQPNEEIAFARMEDLVYESLPTYLH